MSLLGSHGSLPHSSVDLPIDYAGLQRISLSPATQLRRRYPLPVPSTHRQVDGSFSHNRLTQFEYQ